MKTPEPCKNNFEWIPEFNWMHTTPAADLDRKHHEGCVKVMQYGNSMDYMINNSPSIDFPLQDSHDSDILLISLPVACKENSAGITMDNPGDFQLDNAPKSQLRGKMLQESEVC